MNNIFKGKQLLMLIGANFRELMREPAVLFWGIIFPILMSIGLGAAFSAKQDVIRKVGIINSNNSLSNDSSTIKKFLLLYTTKEYHANENITYYSYKIKNEKLGNSIFLFQETNWKDAIVALKRGRINVVMEEKNNGILYSFDPSNPDAQLTYIKLTKFFPAQSYISEENTDNIKLLTLEGTRYIDFLIPGLLAMGVMMSSMWGISYTIIERRSKKLLRRLVSTPMKKSYFLISIITVRFAMNFIEAALLFLFAHIAFGIHIQGNIPALITVFLAGNIAFSGLAVFISSNTSKTEIGNALINVVVMPMMILSGIFFSYHNFPDWFIPIIQKFPLTIMADDIRSIFIEGAGFAEIFIHSLLLSITGILFFITGVKFFKWY
ncbi:MAG: ABC transporter permease [Bacteroidetes bacterium]|nr:ABC transporter permease [Bacteroidota bacterium]